MGKIALAQKPLEIAIGGGADAIGAEGWFLVSVTHGIGLVTVLAVLPVEDRAGGGRLGLVCERVRPAVIPGGDVVPAGDGSSEVMDVGAVGGRFEWYRASDRPP